MPLNRNDLHDYQIKAVDFIQQKERCALLLDMGMGKSVSTLTAISDLIDSMSVQKTLIIAPLRVANSVWAQETEKWDHLKHLRISVCTGSEKARRAALHRDADVYVINRENVVWLVDLYKKKWPFDAVVVDESSSFKNPSAKRFRALKKVLPYTNYMVLLTGTPSPNSLMDLWPQMYLVDFGESLGRTITGYRQRFFEQDFMGYRWTIREGCAEKIHNLISDRVISMSAEDYLDLPDRIDLETQVELPSSAMKRYKELEKTLLAELETGEEVEAVSAAALANKMLQFCIAEGTEVLTNFGWIKIENLKGYELLWDGVEWSNYSELVCKGVKDVVTLDGVRMTEDHEVLTKSGWLTAGEIINGDASEKFSRAEVRIPYGFGKGRIKKQKGSMALPMRLRPTCCKDKSKSSIKTQAKREALRVSPWGTYKNTRHDKNPSMGDVEEHEKSVRKSKGQGFSKLRRSWDFCVRSVEGFLQFFLGGYGSDISKRSYDREDRQFKRLFQGKLSLGDSERAEQQYEKVSFYRNPKGLHDDSASCGSLRNKTIYPLCEDKSLGLGCEKSGRDSCLTYDITNVGLRNRFVVRGAEGQHLIVHNCNGAAYHDEHKNWAEVHKEKLDALGDIVEDNPGENMLVAYNYKFDLERLQKRFPQAVVLDKEQSTIDRWDNGEIQMLLAHPASAGHGLNLQRGGALCVWFGLSWSLELYQQFNARLHRQGQTKPVRIIHIVAKDTIDQRVLSVLKDKDATQSSLLKALKT